MKDAFKLLLLADVHFSGYGEQHKTDEEKITQKGYYNGKTVYDDLKEVLDTNIDNVDHVLFAGDMTDGGKDKEYEPLRILLQRYDSNKISVVPGNHDMGIMPIYLNRKEFKKKFKRNFIKFLPYSESKSQSFPYLKIVGDLAIIGINTTKGFLKRIKGSPKGGVSAAYGEIGSKQRDKLDRLLNEPELRTKLIIILMHHDPYDEQSYWTELGDRKKFKKLVERHSENKKLIVICGHNHSTIFSKPTDNGNVMHIQVPSFGKKKKESSKERYLHIVIDRDLNYEHL